jgi:LysR family glycine cleavage system transcriptional activator
MKRRLPPLNALRAFEAAARLGRMTAAAEELSVTPGAISRQVRHLEDMLGVPLFEGAKNKPQLTPAGATLLPALTAALNQMEAAVREVSSGEAAHAGRLLLQHLYRQVADSAPVRLSCAKPGHRHPAVRRR